MLNMNVASKKVNEINPSVKMYASSRFVVSTGADSLNLPSG